MERHGNAYDQQRLKKYRVWAIYRGIAGKDKAIGQWTADMMLPPARLKRSCLARAPLHCPALHCVLLSPAVDIEPRRA